MTSASAACGNSISQASEMSFRYDRLVVFQIQLTRQIETLPITRDYMVDSERAMRFAVADRSRAHEAA